MIIPNMKSQDLNLSFKMLYYKWSNNRHDIIKQ